MSKPRKTNYSSSKFVKGRAATHSENPIPEQKSIPANTLPSPDSLEIGGDGITFAQVSQALQQSILVEVVDKEFEQIKQYSAKIHKLLPQLNQPIKLNSSETIINYVKLLIDAKKSVLELLAWIAVVANITHHFVVTFSEQLADELINSIENYLVEVGHTFDAVLTNMPKETVLGITLAPEQKQVSETEVIISDILSRLEQIKKENEEAKQDWGEVEQKAYERILAGSMKNISGQEFLDWLSDLEQGHDV